MESATAGRLPRRQGREPSRSRAQYPIASRPGAWQRAAVSGCVRKPRLESDEARLKALCASCRSGNFREVRALVTHFPYLLSLTDAHGFSALHHAEMSGDPAFVAQLLQLYRDPRSFALKVLRYRSEGELLDDRDRGLEICGVTAQGPTAIGSTAATVRCVGLGTLAEAAGVMPGDTLEAIRGASFLSQRQQPPVAKDVLEALRSGHSESLGFPVTLEFRGSACAQILCKDGWTPSHGAAGMAVGRQYREILGHLLNEQEQAPRARDVGGCTPQQWVQMQGLAIGPLRRPLSAGPRGVMLARSMLQAPPEPVRPASAKHCDASIPLEQLPGGQEPQLPAEVPALCRPLAPSDEGAQG